MKKTNGLTSNSWSLHGIPDHYRCVRPISITSTRPMPLIPNGPKHRGLVRRPGLARHLVADPCASSASHDVEVCFALCSSRNEDPILQPTQEKWRTVLTFFGGGLVSPLHKTTGRKRLDLPLRTPRTQVGQAFNETAMRRCPLGR